jgi:hypothetical protein
MKSAASPENIPNSGSKSGERAENTPNARHSKATSRWGTPSDYIAMSRIALGGRIELDPMSEPTFNATVGSERIFTEQDDGFVQDWTCETMLLNPAGELVVPAWRKLVENFATGRVRRCVWIGFSVEQLNLLADEPDHPLDWSFLLTRKRISFVRHDGYIGAPGHANYVVGLGIDPVLFELAFAGRGRFHHGRYATRNIRGDRMAASSTETRAPV